MLVPLNNGIQSSFILPLNAAKNEGSLFTLNTQKINILKKYIFEQFFGGIMLSYIFLPKPKIVLVN